MKSEFTFNINLNVMLTPETFDGTQKQLRKLGLDQNPFVMLSAIGQELLSAGKFKTALSVLKSAEQVRLLY